MLVDASLKETLKTKLKEVFGFSQFRGEQEDIICNLLAGNHTFVIMPTGAGKSMCYQLPAVVSEGTAVIISPLIALMKNQVDQLNAVGVNAQFLNSTLSKSEMTQVKKDVLNGEIKLLYVAPESLTKEENLAFLQKANISFVAIDEAHCISEWGHDFRPEYRRIRHIVETINPELPLIALTATATPKVQQDVIKNLQMEDACVFKSSFNRKNLYYEIRPKTKDVNKQLIKYIKSQAGKSGIIYCLSRKTVEEIAELLNVNGVKALPYHAGLDPHTRMGNQDAFLNEEAEVIVATIAFGMGIDKPDVRFVLHYDAPKSLEGYYQETGRAGRDGLEGNCVMFYSYDDIVKLDKFNKDKPVTERDNAKALLMEMVSYSNIGLCRRRQLLGYFGEYFPKDCGFCDNCLKPTPKFKMQDEVEWILKAVQLTGSRFDCNHIADILLGVENPYVVSHGHNKLDVFGKGKYKLGYENDQDDDDAEEEDEDGNVIVKAKTKATDKKDDGLQTPEFWHSIIKQLTILGFLDKDIENYGTLKISEKAIQFLEAPYVVSLSKDHDYTHQPEEKEDDKEEISSNAKAYDEALFEMLKNLRKKIAKEKNIPPYVIFQDPSMEEMATTYPSTVQELAQITGVGMGKAVKFGKQFIEVITRYVEENEIETATEVVVKTTTNKSKVKIFIIQQIDRKINLEEIAEAKDLGMTELIEEIEHICYSGTKLNLDYYINQLMDDDRQDEIYEYFMSAETDSMSVALQELSGEYSEEELRLMRIKFHSELGH
ncbi:MULTISPECIES: RecQ family ATP-dependent DNA helicase [unclassified Siphonobacter]|uniref:RecQ family ATP-dependent DNA helicase n=1 Tax=unclassified Siphonobacter TaxID=2635712 RepID=UPI000D10E8AE|nr:MULTISPECIES: RecQ family ATP-dependent DNA helicase [unclassified Siphonobacter]